MSGRLAYCHQFWLRKLHSLTGFVFLGYFLCRHVRGEGAYETTFLRIGFLYLPLLFHGLYGLYITFEGTPNLLRYPWVRNWMYAGQRLSGLLMLPFLLLHLGVEFWGGGYGGSSWYLLTWYLGVLVAVFHLANGLFGTVIDWGITVGPHSQRVFVGASFAAFLILAGYGVYTLAHW